MATSLEISKKSGPDRLSTAKKLSFEVKFAKIGQADLQIICLRKIIKKIKKRKKLRTVKYIALSATFAERAKLENTWQSLAYSPLGAIVSPPSEYL